MILSHQHRFIFLKTRKTAGTSLELALSAVCGPDDVITPVVRRDEKMRQGRGPQNFVVPEHLRPRVKGIDGMDQKMRRKKGIEYHNHMSATKLRPLVDPEVWRTYRKITVDRNPWDREVSYYFFKHKAPEGRPSFEDFVLKGTKRCDNYKVYSIDGKVVADAIFRYERLNDDFAEFIRGLGIDKVPELPSAKGAFRPKETRDYRSFYTPETRDAVARYYAREIELLGYEF